ncbi:MULTISPECIES: hypothetical protein [Pseudomonas]|uniref:hypothetical protein n=1 Tax=Pseudomonas TaxID=286 RepID=UPI0013E00FB5|nr:MULTISPECIES: hypothetical protein [Pseudomonas]MBA6135787.1 hypothetical protein [Pseudomonas monteilii]MCA4076503.1 hypothetical protein [Pseudomonas kurunegalensis]MCE0907989.1 hypothetical protein [Pseudomonas kurunegalensis]MDT3748129.1 hypothetical protein [Pseudomonas kurunegalensis]WJR55622.1 hypothetical protein LU664_025315 [Pseudomonas kurunegalensis]
MIVLVEHLRFNLCTRHGYASIWMSVADTLLALEINDNWHFCQVLSRYATRVSGLQGSP